MCRVKPVSEERAARRPEPVFLEFVFWENLTVFLFLCWCSKTSFLGELENSHLPVCLSADDDETVK